VPVRIERRGEARDIDPLELRAEPPEVAIGFERLAAKRGAVSPTFKGVLEPGYELVSYEIAPSEIGIEGPAGLVASTKDISTDIIELSGKTGDFSLTVPLVKPSDLMTLIDTANVRFTARIQQQERRLTLEGIDIRIINLDPSMALSEPLPKGRLTLLPRRGQDSTQPPSVVLQADFRAVIRPGQYTIPLTPIVPEGFDVEAYDPLVVTVRVRTLAPNLPALP
ncbi:MAG: CdaR family protein, partial [Rectinema sp.]|nr:CdaR family protein [Rectinema sp.]